MTFIKKNHINCLKNSIFFFKLVGKLLKNHKLTHFTIPFESNFKMVSIWGARNNFSAALLVDISFYRKKVFSLKASITS